jgi:hypothetical protein
MLSPMHKRPRIAANDCIYLGCQVWWRISPAVDTGSAALLYYGRVRYVVLPALNSMLSTTTVASIHLG